MIAEPSPLRKPLARNRPLGSEELRIGPFLAVHRSHGRPMIAVELRREGVARGASFRRSGLAPRILSEIQDAFARGSGHHRRSVNQSDVLYRLAFACPVPVGNRVRLTWFSRDNPGLFQDAQLPAEPMVEDLDTGVTYTPSWLVAASPMEALHAPTVPSERIIGGLSVVARAEGRAVRTQVVPHGLGRGAATLLTLTPLVLPQTPFR